MSFQQDALRTESRPERLNFNPQVLNSLLSLLITASQIADTAKRAIFYGKPLDDRKFYSGLETLANQADEMLGNPAGPSDAAEGESPVNLRLLHAGLGMFGESGELLEALQKQLNGEPLDLVNVAEELGDVDWYKAIGHDATGVSEEDTRAKVIAKLKKRYPEKFDSERAHERDLAAERAALEGTTAESAGG